MKNCLISQNFKQSFLSQLNFVFIRRLLKTCIIQAVSGMPAVEFRLWKHISADQVVELENLIEPEDVKRYDFSKRRIYVTQKNMCYMLVYSAGC